jgi:hypothetical protein
MCEARPVSTIQVADVAFIAAQPDGVAAALAGAQRWRRWFPDLNLTVTEDRGPRGLRWRVSGSVNGTSEMWIEPDLDGVMLHYFLHAEPSAELTFGQIADEVRRRRVAGRTAMNEAKFTAEAGRRLGEPAVGATTGTKGNSTDE